MLRFSRPSPPSRQASRSKFGCASLGVIFFVTLVVVAGLAKGRDGAQTDASAQTLNLAIIVVPTKPDAEAVLKQLSAGMDFGVLAKEISIDATAVDGGYMGALDPKALRSELRDALGRHTVGQLTDIVQLPSGFAILKILPAPPVSTDLNPERILALISRGEIRFGAPLSGQVEANAIMQEFPKPEGWNRDLREVCKLRTQSLTDAENGLRTLLQAAQRPADHDAALDQVNGHGALGQLLAYSGEMSQSIRGMEDRLRDSRKSHPQTVAKPGGESRYCALARVGNGKRRLSQP